MVSLYDFLFLELTWAALLMSWRKQIWVRRMNLICSLQAQLGSTQFVLALSVKVVMMVLSYSSRWGMQVYYCVLVSSISIQHKIAQDIQKG
jgi:hypothetical protein